MVKYILIAAGGAIGTLLRYFVSNLDYKYSNAVFPLSTFIINITGSFAIGFIWGLSEKAYVSPNIRLFLFIGILGGYTTFSTFSLETFNLIRDSEYKIAISNILLTNVIGISSVFFGFFVSKYLLSIFHKGG